MTGRQAGHLSPPQGGLRGGAIVMADAGGSATGRVESYGPRRMILDSILVEAAARAGAEVRPAFTVDGVLMDGERVAGIRGHARGGATIQVRARLVLGADGRGSLVARAVAAPEYRVRSALACAYYASSALPGYRYRLPARRRAERGSAHPRRARVSGDAPADAPRTLR
jgi:2-polyprenyl-6-methoxyphenol hydroxylase-like FAD-dependent oxidoreductase